MTEFAFMTAHEMAELVRRRKVSPVEIMAACLDHIAAEELRLNAFVTLTGDSAMAEARRCEDLVMEGVDLGPLHGVPMAGPGHSADDRCTLIAIRPPAPSIPRAQAGRYRFGGAGSSW
jgi:hypothetical protein